jgi:acyl phosphate:glycerol-3-phosphate acyltransferase
MSMPSIGALCLAAGGLLAAYLLGAVPFGYLAGRLRGIDVRAVGSGNIGATNVARALGKPWGIAVFLLDAGKGYVAAGPLAWLTLSLMAGAPAEGLLRSGLAPLYALAVSAGHNWPVFLGFRGGRGVATTAGALLAIATLPAAVGLATWAAMVAIFRYVSLASLVAALVTPGLCIALAARDGKLAATWPVWGLTVVLAVLIFLRHRANIGRLLRGQEPKIGGRGKTAGGVQGSGSGVQEGPAADRQPDGGGSEAKS